MAENLRQQLLFEANKKSAGVAYLLLIFLGGFSAHRFYLGQTGTAITQLLLLLLGWIPLFLGWAALGIWLFIDLFLVPGLVRHKNLDLIGTMHVGGPFSGASPSTGPVGSGLVQAQRSSPDAVSNP